MKTLLKIVIALVGLAVVVGVGFAVWVWKNPLAVYVWSTRAALDKSCLERSTMDHPDGNITFWHGGDGPLLVFLHGAGDQAGAWAKVAPAFADRYSVLVPDLPGHGTSDPAEGALPFSAVLAGFERFLEAESGGKPVILVGNSMGAWVSFVYASRHPENVARIVAVDGGPIRGSTVRLVPRTREEARKLVEMLRDPSSPKIPGWVLDDIVDVSADGPIARLAADVPDMERHLMDGRLHEVAVPVDLVWGRSDKLFKKEYVDRLVEGLPASRVTWIERCGHSPNNECPERLLEALEEVLALDPPAPTGGPASGEGDS